MNLAMNNKIFDPIHLGYKMFHNKGEKKYQLNAQNSVIRYAKL